MRPPSDSTGKNKLEAGPNILDSSETYATLDPTGLRHRLRGVPRQCREAWDVATALELPESWRAVDKVIIGGMGGSAMAGDLVGDLAALQQSVPIILVRDFALPFKLDGRSLFIGCSYSGTTAETLSLFRQALVQGAPTLAIAGGGQLAREAGAANVPLLSINSSGEARSAVPYNLMLLLGALNSAGIMMTRDDDVQTAIAAMEEKTSRCHEEVASSENPAKLLARELVDKLIVAYGGGLFSAVARRWKSQLNENAKAWAFAETVPELLHNSVEAFPSPVADGNSIIVLVLQPSLESTELDARYKAVAALLDRGNVPYKVLQASGRSPLAQLLSMLALGDYVSYYLALLKGLDPSPTPVLQLGKDLLSAPGGNISQ